NNPGLKFSIPKEGANVFVDAMCILKNAANKENAETFIDFMTATDNSAANSEFIGYTSPNKEVRDQLELDALTEAVMYPGDEVLARCESFINLPQETLDYYDELWFRLKA
ncbi:MAG: extracellular solute-binding protein, partial [Oscillospiraceae bacterium]|nr:extracellular solute-binding protein [Oscillospiraceae bacterium]